jgi:geranylgeranyl diphosphate synthase type II
MTFESKLLERQVYINEVLDKYLPQKASFQSSILEAMSYSVKVGGKRLRPILMLEIYRLLNGVDEEIEPFLAAIEFIHSYSLVHDDLPAMDDDDYRRGMLTTHKKFGEAMGILAGDALLNYAYEILHKACLDCGDRLPKFVRAMEVLSCKSGIYGMIGGQVVDLESENKECSIEVLNFIHEYKTAALIEASLFIGAVMAEVDEEKLEKISNIGKKIGLAFQIQDDILDIVGSAEILGKPIKSDEKNHKATYVQLIGLEKSKEEVNKLSGEAIDEIKNINGDHEFLIQLIEFLIHREK